MAIIKSCPTCGGKHIVKAGFKITVHKGRQPRRQCQSCGHQFYAVTNPRKKRAVN